MAIHVLRRSYRAPFTLLVFTRSGYAPMQDFDSVDEAVRFYDAECDRGSYWVLADADAFARMLAAGEVIQEGAE